MFTSSMEGPQIKPSAVYPEKLRGFTTMRPPVCGSITTWVPALAEVAPDSRELTWVKRCFGQHMR